MTYDVFISYAAEDAAWATRLEHDLVAAGRKVFRDATRLQVGRRWEQQLQQALDESQHLIALWSKNAKASDWVHKEMGRFERNTENDNARRLICVNLEGQNLAYQTYQNIDVNYADDPAGLDPNVWSRVLAQIRTAIEEDEDVERIDTVVLAMTEAEADPNQAGGLSRAHLDTIKAHFGLAEADVRRRYTGGRLDWHPYGGDLSVRALLDQLIDTVNADVSKVAPDVRFAWRPAPDDFWLPFDTDTPRDVAARLASAKLSLVVVDSLSLQWHEIYRRSILLRDYLKNSSSTWIFVPPLPSEPTTLRYRDLVRNWSAPLLDTYFNPPVPRSDQPAPQFGVFCGDRGEMRRLVLGAVGEYLGKQERAPRSPYTDYRGR
jgi:hypothetical protein